MLNMYTMENQMYVPWCSDGAPSNNALAWHTIFQKEMSMPDRGMYCPSAGPGNAVLTPPSAGVYAWTYTTGYTNGRNWYKTDFGLNGFYGLRNDKWQSNWPNQGSIRKLQNPMAVMAFGESSDRFLGGWAPGNGLIFRHAMNQATNLVFFDAHAETWNKEACKEKPRQLFTISYDTLPWKDF